MSLHSPRAQRHGERPEGKWKHDHKLGDLFTTLQVYQAWLDERAGQRGGGAAKSRQWAREQGVDEAKLFELNRLNAQLCDILRQGRGEAGGSGLVLVKSYEKIEWHSWRLG